MSDNNANPHIPEIQNIDEEWNISPLTDEQVNALYQLNFMLEVTASHFKIPREIRQRIVTSYAVFMNAELQAEAEGSDIDKKRAEDYHYNKGLFLEYYKKYGLMQTVLSYHDHAQQLEDEEEHRAAQEISAKIVQGLKEQGLDVECTIHKASDFFKDNSGYEN